MLLALKEKTITFFTGLYIFKYDSQEIIKCIGHTSDRRKFTVEGKSFSFFVSSLRITLPKAEKLLLQKEDLYHFHPPWPPLSHHQRYQWRRQGNAQTRLPEKNLASFLSKYLLQPILEHGRGDYGSYKVVELLTSTREGLKRQPGQVAAQPEASNMRRKSRGGSTGKEEEFPDGGIYTQLW